VKHFKRHFYIIMSLLLLGTINQAQSKEIQYPVIGMPCPEITFKNIEYYPKRQVNIKDFRGSWLIVDFWNKHCAASMQSLSKINKLRKQFANQVEFLLIGYTGSQYSFDLIPDSKTIKDLYENIKRKQNLDLPVSYDSVLFNQFDIGPCPYVIIIDDKGIVRGITYSITSDDIKDFLNGKNPVLASAFNRRQLSESNRSFDPRKPYLVTGNVREDTIFLFRSLLSKWRPGIPMQQSDYFWSISPPYHLFQLSCVSLSNLYDCAYGDTIWNIPYSGNSMMPNSYGKYWLNPLLELPDSSNFEYDLKTGRGLYCYSLSVPLSKAKTLIMREIMKNDLRNYFGYDVSVELRQMPYWKLIASEDAKINLRTKGIAISADSDADGYSRFEIINGPVYKLIQVLWGNHQSEPPFIDETGIKGNIDIRLDADLSDLNDIKKSLQQYGLDLEKSVKEMKVIIIRPNKGIIN
jgi:hypothetical protein